MLHSFSFDRAIDGFERVFDHDPSCAISQWGIALSLWGNPIGAQPSAVAFEAGRNAIQEAKAAAARTQRERDYIDAAAHLYDHDLTVGAGTRIADYEKAMQSLVERYPADLEAAAFFALALIATQSPSDKTYSHLIRAASILDPLLVRVPDHPGVVHYLIHSRDTTRLAPGALEAARRYTRVGPDEPHALHMPSHIFIRLGLWPESVKSNEASLAAARRDRAFAEVLHALDYLVYSLLQIGIDRGAYRVVLQSQALAAQIDGRPNDGHSGGEAYALAAIPARYALERGRWAEAARLTVHESNTPYADALTHFARVLGAVRGGHDLTAARRDIAKLAAIQGWLSNAGHDYWAWQVEIERQAAAAWITAAEGDFESALRHMRIAADMEDSGEKPALSPGPLLPARELLAELLLQFDRPNEAAEEFRRAAANTPARLRGLYGAGVSAEKSGDTDTARVFFTRLLQNCKDTDHKRSELGHAARFVSRHRIS